MHLVKAKAKHTHTTSSVLWQITDPKSVAHLITAVNRKLKPIPKRVVEVQLRDRSPALLDMAFTLISPVSDSLAADFTDSNLTQIKTLTFPTNSITCSCTGYKLLNDCGLNVAITGAGVCKDFIVTARQREDGHTKWLLTFIYIR